MNMHTSPLQALLQNELAELEAFIALLEKEQDALIKNTLTELIEFAKQKNGRAQTLAVLGKDRKRLFEANGVSLSPHPPHDMMAATGLPADAFPDLSALWRKILLAARRASALNQTNGQLIETRHQQNQQLMMLFQANGDGGSTLSYDAYGQPKLSRRGGSLGKA